MAILSHDDILNLHAAVITAQMVTSRAALLVGIDGHFVAGLPIATTPGDQILTDLDGMNGTGVLADGSVPLAIWLKNAVARAGDRQEATVFRKALERCPTSGRAGAGGGATARFDGGQISASPGEPGPRTSAIPHQPLSVEDVKGKVDFGILTIREDEFDAVLERFPPFTHVKGRRVYNLHRLELPAGGSYLVAVVRCIEQGNTEALDAARDLLEELEPQWLLVVGIAGAVPSDELTLGDVVVSTRIVDFSIEAVLQDKPSEYAMMGGPVHKDAAAILANLRAHKAQLKGWNTAASIMASRPAIVLDDELFYGDEDWQKKAQRAIAHHASRSEPLVTAGAIGSSDRLVKDTQVLAAFLRKAARQVLAVEMESAGVYRGASGRQVPAVAIRGISDVVGFKRDPGWTAYACHTAAAFTHAFLRTQPIQPAGASARVPR
ncbi:phosphorylase family protein [Polyangium mundeleinium]|uniref:Nucleoside phosphorylase domain-containing protein n=1 Tax=Polyangium mundeleinium TaxID=2995306 RepID=A0ABT5F1E6_9BACT|nr:hypothetical protein [Polyangium mundeleinium]MDC0747908.1 hypothetical protein [Polyangium mundeleinium]